MLSTPTTVAADVVMMTVAIVICVHPSGSGEVVR
jgi:hypothetical protein